MRDQRLVKARHKLRHARHALASKRDSKVGDQTGSFPRWVSFRNCSCSTRHVRPCLLPCLLAGLLAGWPPFAPSLSLHFFLAARDNRTPRFSDGFGALPTTRAIKLSSKRKEKSIWGCSAFRHSGCEVARGCSCQRAMQAPHIPPKIARPARFLVLARLCSTDRGGMRPTGRRHQLWQPSRNAAVSARVSLVSIHSTAPPAQIERC